MTILEYEFFRNALVGMVIISVVAAVVGTYIVTRRQVFIAGGITHTCFGGLGLGYFMGWNPFVCAAAFAIAGSLGVDFLSRRRVRQDSATAVIWAFGMALGVLFVFMTSGFVPELNAFLFGNVLSISRVDLWVFGVFALVLGGFYGVFYRRIVAVSFDEDFARTRRLPVGVLTGCMSILTAVAIVLVIKMIGVMLLVAMVSIPQMTAENISRRYGGIMWWSLLISVLGGVGGLWLAYWLDVPASATVVILLTAAWGVSLLRRSYGA